LFRYRMVDAKDTSTILALSHYLTLLQKVRFAPRHGFPASWASRRARRSPS
jgi:hypothetical protein